jgi:hypothetical protein
MPHIRFKKIQAQSMYYSIQLLMKKSVHALTVADRRRLMNCVLRIQNENYSTRGKKSKRDLEKVLDLTP